MAYQRENLAELAAALARQHPRLTAAEASARLRVHRHTLQRALEARGLSLSAIKQAVALDRLERHFAAAEAASLKQVWSELGFASASAFARYIRHATGKSPSELRATYILGQSGHKRAKMGLELLKQTDRC